VEEPLQVVHLTETLVVIQFMQWELQVVVPLVQELLQQPLLELWAEQAVVAV